MNNRDWIALLESRTYWSVDFSTPIDSAASAVSNVVFTPEVLDVNGDSKLDLVLTAADAQGTPTVYHSFIALGNGDGSFLAPTEFPNGTSYLLDKGDFNGDGKADLIGFGADSTHFTVFRGSGSSFTTALQFEDLSNPTQLKVGDINGDGRTDVVVLNNDSTISVYLGDATATLIPGTSTALGTSSDVPDVLLKDVNHDGRDDLIVYAPQTNILQDTIVITRLSNGDGTFGGGFTTVYKGVLSLYGSGDFTGDGNVDLILGTQGDDGGVVPGRADGGFGKRIKGPVDPQLTGDFDNDGNLDGVDQFPADSSVRVNVGRGNGTFGPQIKLSSGSSLLVSPVVADLNGDGRSDVAAFSNAGSGIVISTFLGQRGGPNLVPSAATAIPTSVVGGSSGRVSVQIDNTGVETASGKVQLNLIVSTDPTGAGGIQVKTLTKKLKIAAGRSVPVRVDFNYPDSLPSGNYFLVAQVAKLDGEPETSTLDNTVSLGTVTIAAPVVDLNAVFASAALSLQAGKKGTILLDLTDNGNVLAAGTLPGVLSATAAGQPDLSLGTPRLKIKLTPNQTKRFKISFTVPKGTPAATYAVSLAFTPVGAIPKASQATLLASPALDLNVIP